MEQRREMSPPTTTGEQNIAYPSDRSPSGASTESMSARLSMLLSPARKSVLTDGDSDPVAKLRQAASTFRETPSIFVRPTPPSPAEKRLESSVPDWTQVRRSRNFLGVRRDLRDALSSMRTGDVLSRQSVQKVSKVSKSKGHTTGRTYTSKYRGVHQTFPTKRWEAQFRRNGKPTSLGCFDEEEEAARAYDKMMIWCELNQTGGVKAGITNFDMSEYEKDIPVLNSISQDDLVQALRSDGRRQAAQRILRQKRDGQLLYKQSGYTTP